MSKTQWRSIQTSGNAATLQDVTQELLAGGGIRTHSVSLGNEDTAVVVRSSGEPFHPRSFSTRTKLVAIRHFVKLLTAQVFENGEDELISSFVPTAIHGFKRIKQDEQLLKMIQSQTIIDAVKRDGHRRGQSSTARDSPASHKCSPEAAGSLQIAVR